MKKLILIILCLMMVVSLAACETIEDFIDKQFGSDEEIPDESDDEVKGPDTDCVTGDNTDKGDEEDDDNDTDGDSNITLSDKILIIEGKEGEGKELKALLSDKFSVTDVSLYEDLIDVPVTADKMAEYGEIILVNVAYKDMPYGFEEALNEYVHEFGGALFTVGGELDEINGDLTPHSYNPKDIAKSTYYKQMLPVTAIDFAPPVAVVTVIDTSSSMATNAKLEAAKLGALSCLDALNERDYFGVMSFGITSTELVEVAPVSEKERIKDAINNIEKEDMGGGTIFSNAIMRAGRALSSIENVERKHIIIVTDGLPADSYEDYLPYIQDNIANGITMSIVTIGQDNENMWENMQSAATAGGGSHYNVSSSDTIPVIMKNDISTATSTEIEYVEEFRLTVKDPSSILTGIDTDAIPLLSGYFSAEAKDGATVVLMGEYVPIYAEWSYGEGKVGSFMCDLSGIWSYGFMEDVIGKTIIENIVASLFSTETVTEEVSE